MDDWSELSFRAMGSDCRIVAPDAALASAARTMVRDLEQRWSRFVPSSEICALNELDGRLCIVTPETYELVSCAERARQATGGAFNPLMLDHLEHAGYDRTWSRVRRIEGAVGSPPSVSVEPIELFPEVRGVRLPAGTRFDPGGIGKGLAGDLVTDELVRFGATRTQVELGGDVRLSGPAWDGDWWRVRVDDSDHGAESAASITVPHGGVATSSSVRRSWRRGTERMHHLIDPTTGRPASTDLAAVSIAAPTLWWAEVVAKVAVISGSVGARELVRRLDMSGVLVHAAPVPGIGRYEVVSGGAHGDARPARSVPPVRWHADEAHVDEEHADEAHVGGEHVGTPVAQGHLMEEAS